MDVARIEAAMERAVGDGVFPGAVLLVRQGAAAPFLRAFGARRVDRPGESMTPETIFDVSSLTKAFATSVALMQLVAADVVRLDDPVERHCPEFRGPGKDGVTVRHLLSHASGLPAWRPFFERVRASSRASFLGSPEAREFVHREAARTPLERPPGTAAVYSDVGFLLLGAIVESASGRRLDRYCDERIFTPLGLERCGFVAIPAGDASAKLRGPFAATEDCPWRGAVLCGVVHDDNAYVMGGVAGHAGLFATASDLDALLCHLREAYCGRSAGGIVRQDVVRSFWTRAATAPASTWCLGWDTPSAQGSSAGSRFPPHSVGHLGFTGVSAWLDLDRERHILLLTNRVHPTRTNEAIRTFRPQIHDLIVAAIEGNAGSSAR